MIYLNLRGQGLPRPGEERPIKAVLFEGSSFQLLEFGDPTAAAAAKADGTPAPRAAAASDARE